MPVILVLDTSSTQAGLISSLIKVTCATHSGWQLLQLQGFIIKVVVLEFEHYYTDYAVGKFQNRLNSLETSTSSCACQCVPLHYFDASAIHCCQKVSDST